MLEDEVAALLNTNQQLKSENVVLHESVPLDNTSDGKRDLKSELANAKAEVVGIFVCYFLLLLLFLSYHFDHICYLSQSQLELQASQKHLQELADISQAQVHMLDQLHERSEHQLDALRQVMFKVQCETDLGAEIGV